MKVSEITQIVKRFRKAKNKLILLDYDGTLVNYDVVPANAKITGELSDILSSLAVKEATTLFIISGRGHIDIDKLLGQIPVNVVSEHGAMIRENKEWEIMIGSDNGWKKIVSPIMVQITGECPGSFIEEKEYSLVWHYRGAEEKSGAELSKQLVSELTQYVNYYELKVLDGNKVVEVLNRKTGKGEAVRQLTGKSDYDFILSVGDDVTDEEMFLYFLENPVAYTVKVGRGKSAARYNLDGIEGVISLLKQLSE